MGKKEHIAGIYTLIAALIGAAAVFGGIYYTYILNKEDKPKPTTSIVEKSTENRKPPDKSPSIEVSNNDEKDKIKRGNKKSVTHTLTVDDMRVELIECKRGGGSVTCKILVTSIDKDERVCISGGFAMVDNEGVNYGISNATNIGGKSPHFLGGEFCITLFDNAPMKGNIIYTGNSTADTAKVVIVGIGKKRFRYADIPIL